MANAKDHELSRRDLLRMGLATTTASVLIGGLELTSPVQTRAQSTLSPNAAADELMAGNKRFTSGRLTAHEQDLAILKQHTEEKQEPFAVTRFSPD